MHLMDGSGLREGRACLEQEGASVFKLLIETGNVRASPRAAALDGWPQQGALVAVFARFPSFLSCLPV